MVQIIPQKQQGATLVVALVMLLVLTIVGVTTSQDATIQERLSSNNQQLSIARTNAHSALVAAEEYLEGLNIETFDDVVTAFDTVDGLYMTVVNNPTNEDAVFPADDMTKPDNWDNDNSLTVTTGVSGFSTARFYVEYIGYLNNQLNARELSLDDEDKGKTEEYPLAFRITALGYGATDNTSILQSIYSTQQGTP